MGGWVDGWMGGWVDGWMGGWVDGLLVAVVPKDGVGFSRVLDTCSRIALMEI